MTTAIDDITDTTLFDYANWALETSIWNGRKIEWTEASDFYKEAVARILCNATEASLAKLAWLGSGRTLELEVPIATPVGLGKTVSKFWKNHKTEILVGVAIIAAITAIAVVAICVSGSAAAAAGGVALVKASRNSSPPSKAVPQEKGPPSSALGNTAFKFDPPSSLTMDKFEISKPEIGGSSFVERNPVELEFYRSIGNGYPASKPPQTEKVVFQERGVLIDGQFSSYRDILDHNPSQLSRWFADGPQLNIDPSKPPSISAPLGSSHPACRIGGINGINTTQTEAESHANYLRGIAQNSVDWVYNRTNRIDYDILEVFLLNYAGLSPNTARDLKEQWTSFHEENKDRPQVKYLQFCHSQGAIHVRNALADLPEEIRKRVIVVAIAPAAVVPDEICYRSFNYASKRDLIPKGELVFTGFIDPNECGSSERMKKVMGYQDQLIMLDPHPDAGIFDHDFQSPTYKEHIKNRIDEYLMRNGEYD